MIEPPQVTARAEVQVTKESSQQTFGHCNRERAQKIADASSLVGAHCARDFANAVFALGPIGDDEFPWAVKVVLEEFGSEDLWPKIFAKNNSSET
jgi:hypothetical protein